VFLAIGIGAILQVVWEVGKLIQREADKHGQPLMNWTNLAGVVVGFALMYFTAFFVKF
jgi:zinc transporter, ZIP family